MMTLPAGESTANVLKSVQAAPEPASALLSLLGMMLPRHGGRV